MNFTAFNKKGNWYKGNLHSHTVNSDGRLTAQASAEIFKAHGYNFLAFTEHDLFTDYRKELNTKDFIILPGIEVSAYLYDENNFRIKAHHLNGILGPSDFQKKADGLFSHKQYVEPLIGRVSWNGAEVSQEITDNLRSHGCIVMYNHPIWSRVSPEEYINTKGLWALEVFNYDTQNECAQGFDTHDWDIMLDKNIPIFGAATDDSHHVTEFDDACGGYIMVQADSLTHDTILHAMLGGNFYSSSGPVIHNWGVMDDTMWVDCSECGRVNFIAGGAVGTGRTVFPALPGGKVIHAEYKIKGGEKYMRIECVDFSGKTAWTNPFFLK